jgi:hypothetical protein
MNINDIIKSIDISNKPNTFNKIIKLPTKEQLLLMLKEEEKIRFSEEYISECDNVAHETNGWLRISEEKQYEIAKKFGFSSDIESDIAVNHMRRAQYLYPEEDEFKKIPVYVRNNYAKQSNYSIGDIVPNIQIHTFDLNTINLYDTFQSNKINILIASSHT